MNIRWGLLFLFVLALIPRVTGLLWGGVHPDENFSLSVKVLAGDLIPDTMFYPPLLNYLNACAFAVMFLFGKLLGVWQSTQDFRQQWFEDPTPFYFTARLVTALLGALSSPLAYLIAKHFGCRRYFALFVGVIVALYPANILFSHISKSDVGLCTALFFLIWVHVAGYSKKAPWLLGFATALALSFKHSSIFFIGPFLAMIGLWPGVSFFLGFIPSLLFFNLGIFLDMQHFLAFQKIQSYLAIRPSSFSTFFQDFLPLLGSDSYGVSWVVLPLWLVVPFVVKDRRMTAIWLATLIGLIFLVFMTGNRVLPQILLPFSMLIVLTTVISFAFYRVGVAASLMTCLVFAYGTFQVVSQSVMPPLSYQVSHVLASIKNPRVLTSDMELIDIPVNAVALEEEDQRQESLAKKYRIELPPRARERLELRKKISARSLYVREIPWALGGLELYEEDEVPIIKAYTWPIQEEEWSLDYWTAKGITIFVVENEDFYLRCGIPEYERLHREIKERGTLIKELPTQRPLFFESDVKIYSVES